MTTPAATYRLQFSPDLNFETARDILPYLKQLGISHIYASPILQTTKGSTHGYDVVEPRTIDADLGGEEGFEKLSGKAKELELGWIQDIVPNHMAFDSSNGMLMDVLEKGQASAYQEYFDIDWNHIYANLNGKLLAPFLGGLYGRCLDNGEITLAYGEKGFFIRYYDIELPVRLTSYPGCLKRAFDLAGKAGMSGETDPLRDRVISLFGEAVKTVRSGAASDRAKKEVWRAYTGINVFREVMDGYLEHINSRSSESLDELDGLISEQLFRLSFWKVGNDELNYRRFFTINSLICLRTEKPEVFNDTHIRIFDLVEKGYIDGLRVDHVDGLYEPYVYLSRLRERGQELYLIVEKILGREEKLPREWPVQGTTGYDFLNYLNGLFVDPRGERGMTGTFTSVSGRRMGFDRLVTEKKRLFMDKHMAGDIDNLAHLLKENFSNNRYTVDLTMYGLKKALLEIMAHFGVYRTYAFDVGVSDPDRFYIKRAAERARHAEPDLQYELEAIQKVLLMEPGLRLDDDRREGCIHFTKKFQQLTAALMAKGEEDTADYIYNRLLSLNEVGGFPDHFGVSPEEFHAFNLKRSKQWPHTMNATATHDTKRGEDTRSRINVLSEIPGEWKEAVKRWRSLNRKHKSRTAEGPAPDGNDEYLIYQTLVGAFPFSGNGMSVFRERMKEYILKAVREAKVHTAWIEHDERYEKACTDFIERILSGEKDNEFLSEFTSFQKKIAHWGVFNSLSQMMIKLTSPGVPDIYQGSELWDLSLVDPDNRRPVDFARRKELFRKIKNGEKDLRRFTGEMFEDPESGIVKMFVLYRVLRARSDLGDVFTGGKYLPLKTEGAQRDHVIAFARIGEKARSITAVPRFLSGLVKAGELPLGRSVWGDTRILLPRNLPGEYRDAITLGEHTPDDHIMAGDVFAGFPVSLLMSGMC